MENSSVSLNTFNRTIQVEVEVDEIASSLMATMDVKNPHSALIVNTIIGQALSNNRLVDLGRIHSAVSGRSTKLNFYVGQELYCDHSIYDSLIESLSKRRPMGIVRVLHIDPLKDDNQVLVEFEFFNKGDDKPSTSSLWVNRGSLKEATDDQKKDHLNFINLVLDSISQKSVE